MKPITVSLAKNTTPDKIDDIASITSMLDPQPIEALGIDLSVSSVAGKRLATHLITLCSHA